MFYVCCCANREATKKNIWVFCAVAVTLNALDLIGIFMIWFSVECYPYILQLCVHELTIVEIYWSGFSIVFPGRFSGIRGISMECLLND